MPELETSVEFTLECWECTSRLEDSDSIRRKGIWVVIVKPCASCLENAKLEGRAEGEAK